MKRLLLCLLLAPACSSDVKSAATDAANSDPKTLLEVAMANRSRLEPRFRAQFRADLGAAHARAGNAAQAQMELEQALEEANALSDPGDRDRVMMRVAKATIVLGKKNEARAIAEKLGGIEQRGEILGELADDYAQANALPTAGDRDRALARLAIRDAANGEIDRAGSTVAKIGDPNLRPPVMYAITAAMLKEKRTVDANRLAGSLDGLAKSEAAAALVMDATIKGETKSAKRWIKLIDADLIRARTSAVQATLLPMGSSARKKAAEEATRVALDIGSNDLRQSSIEVVAQTFANNRDPAAAAAVLEAALAEPVRNQPGRFALDNDGARRVRTLVAQAWAATGAVDQASRQAQQIDDALLQAEAWASVARAAVAKGDHETALAAAARIIPDELRVPVVADIAVAPNPAEITAALRQAMANAIVRDVASPKR